MVAPRRDPALLCFVWSLHTNEEPSPFPSPETRTGSYLSPLDTWLSLVSCLSLRRSSRAPGQGPCSFGQTGPSGMFSVLSAATSTQSF